MKRFVLMLLLLGLLCRSTCFAQSMVVAKPVSDTKGMVAFQITEVLKVEGDWSPPLTIGELIYPAKRQKAHPIMRFGEAVVIALTEPGNRTKWQGLHVHNGCIPALQGKPLEEMEQEIVKQAEAEALAAKNSPNSATSKTRTATGGASRSSGPEEYAVCPICKQRHIRIR